MAGAGRDIPVERTRPAPSGEAWASALLVFWAAALLEKEVAYQGENKVPTHRQVVRKLIEGQRGSKRLEAEVDVSSLEDALLAYLKS